MTFWKHLVRFCQSGRVLCEVHIGAPIRLPPDMDRKCAARQAEAAVRKLAQNARERDLRVPVSQKRPYITGSSRPERPAGDFG